MFYQELHGGGGFTSHPLFISRPSGSHKYWGVDAGSAPRSVQPNHRGGFRHYPEMAKIRRGLDPPHLTPTNVA